MNKGPFELIIFDYDGVIADSELLNNTVMAELLTEIGLPTTLDDALATYMGKRWRDCETIISTRLGAPCPPGVQAEWTRRCHERAHHELKAVTGFNSFLVGRREPLCIASSSPPDWIELGLSRFGAHNHFSGSIFSAAIHVSRGKPHPDLFFYAADAMKAAPERTLVIEDSPTGVLAGVAAGMTVVGLCAGGHIRSDHAQSLLQSGAHQVFDTYADLEEWVSVAR
ncbi:HAD family hydrolase [Brevundimonas diminuta]|uniref:HAD family hydrolase n=1 Tax=Brevundimonas diminuta TaxID=293 RepID=UPI003D077638